MTSSPPPSAERYHALDGLRGAAALVVVVTHLLVCIPTVSEVIWDRSEPRPGTLEHALFRTPAVLFTLGDQAVMIFFVLSGFVLAIPMLRMDLASRATLSYYARRLVRLYIPVWAALLFAALLALCVPRDGADGGAWLASHPQPTVALILRDGLLLTGTSNLNSPLWSLTWEMWFSLLLPAMILAYRALRVARWWVPCLALLILMSALSRWPVLIDALPLSWLSVPLLRYLPVFAVGIILAAHREEIATWTMRWPRTALDALAVATGMLLVAVPMTAPLTAAPAVAMAEWAAVVLTSAGVVLVVLVHPAVGRWLSTGPLRWLGAHSFSLYLTHEPIIVSAAVLMGVSGWMPWLAVAPLLVALSLLTAAAFYRLVEKPSHLMARAAGSAVQGRTALAT